MNRQRELIYDVGTRCVSSTLGRYEAFAPDLPGFRVEMDSEFGAYRQAQQALIEHLASLSAAGKSIPVPQMNGRYLGDKHYAGVVWHFLKVNLGPRKAGTPMVEPVFPDFLEDEFTHLD
ncbi:type II toxin-antitoxin system HicB family antitoxin [Halomonas binhaiensis]|uniref:Type II toxin-antitoxin system HicB family antitoxin n=1 Tax=Halomonas binhaiensis TaxID=2562282 RepID=A0A5C1NEJ4_9GAMM|nr:type II toxin-antitoxin system HicB family antitoxin [Halomonas binhaiensis]QEM81674.1 type II toxin-antitoxin system HicB family antitoxin [Halomonas binhaiensis]